MNSTLKTLLISWLVAFANCGPQLGPSVSYEETTTQVNADMSQPTTPDAAIPILQCTKQDDKKAGEYCCAATCLASGIVRIFFGKYDLNNQAEIYCNTNPTPLDYDCKKEGMICMASDDIGGCTL